MDRLHGTDEPKITDYRSGRLAVSRGNHMDNCNVGRFFPQLFYRISNRYMTMRMLGGEKIKQTLSTYPYLAQMIDALTHLLLLFQYGSS